MSNWKCCQWEFITQKLRETIFIFVHRNRIIIRAFLESFTKKKNEVLGNYIVMDILCFKQVMIYIKTPNISVAKRKNNTDKDTPA